MPKGEDLPFFNMSDPDQKSRIIRHLQTLEGVHEFKIRRVKDQRSLQQNAYYWGVVLAHAAKGFREQFGELSINSLDAHEFFKDRYLKIPTVNRNTGEVIGYRAGSSAELDRAEFAQYLENVIKFCLDFLGVVVPPATKIFTEPGTDTRKTKGT